MADILGEEEDERDPRDPGSMVRRSTNLRSSLQHIIASLVPRLYRVQAAGRSSYVQYVIDVSIDAVYRSTHTSGLRVPGLTEDDAAHDEPREGT